MHLNVPPRECIFLSHSFCFSSPFVPVKCFPLFFPLFLLFSLWLWYLEGAKSRLCEFLLISLWTCFRAVTAEFHLRRPVLERPCGCPLRDLAMVFWRCSVVQFVPFHLPPDWQESGRESGWKSHWGQNKFPCSTNLECRWRKIKKWPKTWFHFLASTGSVASSAPGVAGWVTDGSGKEFPLASEKKQEKNCGSWNQHFLSSLCQHSSAMCHPPKDLWQSHFYLCN